MKIKICGMTNLADALSAVESGADALGFVLAPESPRSVSVRTVQNIIRGVPPFVTTVAVVTGGTENDLRGLVEEAGVDLIQFHFAHAGPLIASLSSRAIQVIRVRDEKTFETVSWEPARAYLLDSFHGEVAGGSGVPFNWGLALRAKTHGRVILAGGLTPENVQTAIETVGPYAVDVCSGVEASPGKKDPVKLAAFIRAAKGADAASR